MSLETINVKLHTTVLTAGTEAPDHVLLRLTQGMIKELIDNCKAIKESTFLTQGEGDCSYDVEVVATDGTPYEESVNTILLSAQILYKATGIFLHFEYDFNVESKYLGGVVETYLLSIPKLKNYLKYMKAPTNQLPLFFTREEVVKDEALKEYITGRLKAKRPNN